MNLRSVLKVLMFFSCWLIVSEQSKIIEETNSFGGKTIEITYEFIDKNSTVLEASRLYYDQNGTLVKSISKTKNNISEKTGIRLQEEQYLNNRVSFYKMYMTESEKMKRGYDYIIEYLEDDDTISTCGYGFGDVLFKERTDTFSYKYPFNSLKYLFSKIYEEPYIPNKTGDEITYSLQYNKGRAFVVFSNNPNPINDKDKAIINYYFNTNGIAGSEIYSNKIIATENGKQYTLFIQDGLLPYCEKGKKGLISFVVIGFNHNIYPLITSIIDGD